MRNTTKTNVVQMGMSIIANSASRKGIKKKTRKQLMLKTRGWNTTRNTRKPKLRIVQPSDISDTKTALKNSTVNVAAAKLTEKNDRRGKRNVMNLTRPIKQAKTSGQGYTRP